MLSNIFYHYCSVTSFKAILENSTLRFSDIMRSNDKMELKYLFKAYARFMLSKSKTYNYLPMQIFESEAEKVLDNLSYYCFCLSKKSDKLSMWRGYCNDGGFAIGFSHKHLVEIQNSIIVSSATASLEKITYCCSNNFFSKFNEELLINNFGKLMECAVHFKDKSFEEECETRVYFQNFTKPDNNQRLPAIKVKLGEDVPQIINIGYTNQLVSFYDIPFSLNQIDEIWIGPDMGMGKTDVCNFVEQMAVKHKSKFDIAKIHESKIPFRKKG